jgi:hypothetical protein
MPTPAPPPRLTRRSAEVHDVRLAVTALEPPAGAEVPGCAVVLEDEAGEPDEPDDGDDAAQPAARTLAASSGTASIVFFTRSPIGLRMATIR